MNEDDTFLALRRTPAEEMWRQYRAEARHNGEQQMWITNNGWTAGELLAAWEFMHAERVAKQVDAILVQHTA